MFKLTNLISHFSRTKNSIFNKCGATNGKLTNHLRQNQSYPFASQVCCLPSGLDGNKSSEPTEPTTSWMFCFCSRLGIFNGHPPVVHLVPVPCCGAHHILRRHGGLELTTNSGFKRKKCRKMWKPDRLTTGAPRGNVKKIVAISFQLALFCGIHGGITMVPVDHPISSDDPWMNLLCRSKNCLFLGGRANLNQKRPLICLPNV